MPIRMPRLLDQIQEALAGTGEPYNITQDPSFKNRFYVRRNDSNQTLTVNATRSDVPSPAGPSFLISSSTGRKQTAVTGSMSASYNRDTEQTNFGISSPSQNLALSIDAAFNRVQDRGHSSVQSAFNNILTMGDEEYGIPRFPSVSTGLPTAAQQKVVGQMAFQPRLLQNNPQAKNGTLAPWEVAKVYDQYKARTQYATGPVDQFSRVDWMHMRGMQPGVHGNLEPMETEVIRAVMSGNQVTGYNAVMPKDPLKTMKARTTSFGRETAPPWQRVDGVLQGITPADIRGNASNVNYALSNVLYPGERSARPMEIRDFVATPDILLSGGAFAYQNRRDVHPTAFGPESNRSIDLQVGNLYEFGNEGNTFALNKIVGQTFGGGRQNATIGNLMQGGQEYPMQIPIGPSDFSVRGVGMVIPPYMNETTGAPAPAPGPGIISSAAQARVLQQRLGVPVTIGASAIDKTVLNVSGVQVMGGAVKTPGVKFGEIPVPREMSVRGGGRDLPVSYATSEIKSDAFIRFGFFGARSYEQTAGMFRDFASGQNAPQGAGQFADWFGKTYAPTAKGNLKRWNWETLSGQYNKFTGQDLTGSQLANSVFENVILGARGDAGRNARNIEQYEAGFLDPGSEISHGPASPDYIASLRSAAQRDYMQNVQGSTDEQFSNYWSEHYRQGSTPEGAAYPELMQKLSSEAMWMRSAVQRVPEYMYRTRLNPEAQQAISTAYPEFSKQIGSHPTNVISRSKSGAAFDELRAYTSWETSAARGELGELRPTKMKTVSSEEAAQMYTILKQGSGMGMKDKLKALQEVVGSEQQPLYFKGTNSFFPHPSTISDLVYSKFGKEFGGLAIPYGQDLARLTKAEAQGRGGDASVGLNLQSTFFSRVNRILTSGGEAAKASLNVKVGAAIGGSYSTLPALRSYQVGGLPDVAKQLVRNMGARGERWVGKIAEQLGQVSAWGALIRYPQQAGTNSAAGVQALFGDALQSVLGRKGYQTVVNDPRNAGTFYTSVASSQAYTGDQDMDKAIMPLALGLKGKSLITLPNEELQAAALTNERAMATEKANFTDPALRDKVNAIVSSAGDARVGGNVFQKVIDSRAEYPLGDLAQAARDRQLQKTIGIGTGYDIRRALIPAMGMLGYSDSASDRMLNAMPASYQIPLDFMSTSSGATGTDIAAILAGANTGMAKNGEGYLSVRTNAKENGRPQVLSMTPASIKSGDYLLDFLSPIAQIASNPTETRSGKSYNLFGAKHLASMFGLEGDQEALGAKLEGLPADQRGRALTGYLTGIGPEKALRTPFMGGVFARVISKANNKLDMITGEEQRPGALEAVGQFNAALGEDLAGRYAGASVFHDVLHRYKSGLQNISARRVHDMLKYTPSGRFHSWGTNLARKAGIPVPMRDNIDLQEKVLGVERRTEPNEDVQLEAAKALGIDLNRRKRDVESLGDAFDFDAIKKTAQRANSGEQLGKTGVGVFFKPLDTQVDAAVAAAVTAVGGMGGGGGQASELNELSFERAEAAMRSKEEDISAYSSGGSQPFGKYWSDDKQKRYQELSEAQMSGTRATLSPEVREHMGDEGSTWRPGPKMNFGGGAGKSGGSGKGPTVPQDATGGANGGGNGGNGGKGSFWDRPPSPTKANLMVERAYAKLGKVQGRANKLDFFVKDVLSGMGVNIDTQPMDEALHQVLSTNREDFVSRIGPQRMKQISQIGKVRDQASQAFGNIGYSRYVAGTEQYETISSSLNRKSSMYNMALISGVMDAGEGANPYTMGALQDMEGNQGFRGLSTALRDAGFGQGNIPGEEQAARIQQIVTQNPQYKTMMNRAARLTKGVPSDLVPQSVAQVANITDAIKRIDPSILKESSSSGSSAGGMALPEDAVKRLNALYKEQADIMSRVSTVKGTEIEQLKKEYDMRSKAISSIQAPYKIAAIGQEIAGYEQQLSSGGYSADVEKKLERARGMQGKLMSQYASDQEPEQNKAGQFFRHTLGGFGLMYMRSVAGIITGGFGYGEKERLSYDQEQAQLVGQSTGGRMAPQTQSQMLQNRMALAGVNNNPLDAVRMLGTKAPVLQNVWDIGSAGVGTYGVTSWLAGQIGGSGGAALQSSAAGIAGLAMAGYGAAEIYSRTQDPKGMSRRMGMQGGGWNSALSPFDFLAVGSMGIAQGLQGKDMWGGQVGKVINDTAMIAKLQETMASGATSGQIARGFANVPKPDLMASMLDIANQNGYAPEHNARAVSFLMRQGDQNMTQANIDRYSQDYASGISSEDLASKMLTASGFNATRQFSRNGYGTEVLGSVTQSLMNKNMSDVQRNILNGGIQAAGQVPGIAFVPGVGALGGKQVEERTMEKFFSKLEALTNTPAFSVYQSQMSTWQTQKAAGLTNAPAPTPYGLSPDMSIQSAAFQTSQQQALQNQAQARLSMASGLQSRSYGFGNKQLGDDLYNTYSQAPVGQEWFYNKLFSGDAQAFGAMATRGGMQLSKMPGLKTLNGDTIGAEYAAYTDVGLNGQLTGMKWGSSSFRMGDVSGATMAGRIWGNDWKTSGQFDTAAIQAGVSGYKLSAPITLPNGQQINSIGGTMGMNLYAAQLSRDQQLAQLNLQNRGTQLQTTYTKNTWELEDKSRALQNNQAQWQFGFQQRQLNVENKNWSDNFALNARQNQMQRGFTQQEWGFNAGVRDMQWGWQQEDFQEESRFMTGRQRKIAERGQKRATIMHDVEGEHIEQQQNQQKQLWRLEDERFHLEKTQHAQSVAMQQEALDKNKEFYEQNRKLQEQETKLSRAYFLEQTKLQQQSTAMQAAYAKQTFQLQKTMAQLETAVQMTNGQLNNLADDAFEGLYKAMVKANPKLKEMIDQVLRIADHSSSGGGSTGGSSGSSGTGTGQDNAHDWQQNNNNSSSGSSGSSGSGSHTVKPPAKAPASATPAPTSSSHVTTDNQWGIPIEQVYSHSLGGTLIPGVHMAGEKGFEFIIGNQVVPHELSKKMYDMGLRPGATEWQAKSKMDRIFASQAAGLSKGSDPAGGGYFPIAQSPSSSGGGDSIPINVYIGNEKIASFIVDTVTKEIKNG